MPLLSRKTPSAVGLVMGLSLRMLLGIVVLLLLVVVLMRWVHVGVGLRVLLARHVVGVGGPFLLVVGRVLSRTVEGVNGLVVVRVVSRGRHGPGHDGLAVVWMWRVPYPVWTHGSIHMALGVRRHGWIVTRRGPPRSLHTRVATHQLGSMVIGAKILLFINNTRRPGFHHCVLRRDGGTFCIRFACRLAGSLITVVCWARLGG